MTRGEFAAQLHKIVGICNYRAHFGTEGWVAISVIPFGIFAGKYETVLTEVKKAKDQLSREEVTCLPTP